MPTIDEKRQIRFLLDESAHDQVRVAAALRRTTMANFCRTVVMREAAAVTGEIQLPVPPARKTKRSNQK